MNINSSIIGFWRLNRLVAEDVETGAVDVPFSEHPTGHTTFTKGGRMMTVIVSGDRTSLSVNNPTDEERVALFKSMLAYSGPYRIEDDKIVTDVQVSWNGSWTGTRQVRFAEMVDKTLTLKTAPFKSPQTGRMIAVVAIWEKME